MGVSRSHSEFFFLGKSSQNSSKPVLICWTLIRVVSYYDLSVLSMSVIGFQKKDWMSGGGGRVG